MVGKEIQTVTVSIQYKSLVTNGFAFGGKKNDFEANYICLLLSNSRKSRP